jgi:ribosomal-protein-alanine N-acetyltransferase
VDVAVEPNTGITGGLVTLKGVAMLDEAEMRALIRKNESYWQEAAPPIEGEFNLAQALEAWVRRIVFVFGIARNDSGELVGWAELSDFKWRPFRLSAEVGYAVDEDHTGNDFATDALRLLCGAAFEGLGLRRLEAGVQSSNGASIRVPEKVGFNSEGIARDWMRVASGWADHQIFAMTEPDWRALHRSEERQ